MHATGKQLFLCHGSSFCVRYVFVLRRVRLPHSIANNRDIGIAFVHDPFKTFEKQYVGMVYAIYVVNSIILIKAA